VETAHHGIHPTALRQEWVEALVGREHTYEIPGAVQQALQRAPDDIKVVMEFAQP
jgi:hypothetical protein